MSVNWGKKYKQEVDIDRAEWSLFLSNSYLKCLKQSCYPSFIVSQSLEFGDFFLLSLIIIITLAVWTRAREIVGFAGSGLIFES